MGHNELEGQISLEDYLTDLDGPLDTTETEMGTDDVWANRMLRELSVAEKQIKANSDMAEKERAKITGWEAVVNEPLQNRAVWLRERIAAYAAHVRATEDRKTVNLPFGKVTTTPKADEWEIEPHTFIGWAKQSGIANLYRVPEPVPNRTVIKGAFIVDSDGGVITQDGEEVPGIVVKKSNELNVSIKVN